MIRTASILASLARIRPHERREGAVAALYVGLYVLLDWLSYAKPLPPLGITPWNPQAGLTLAFLLFLGPRWFPGTVVAVLLAQFLVHVTDVGRASLFVAALWIGVGYGALACVVRRQRLADLMATSVDAARMTAVLIAGTLVIAAGYVGLFIATGECSASEALPAIARYWIGDLNGVLTLTPLLIHVPKWRAALRTLRQRALEVLAQVALIAVVLWAVLMLPAQDQLRFFYLLFVPVIWIALRWTWHGALLAVLVIQVGLLVAAGTKIPTARFIDLQFLMLTLSLSALLLGAVVAERAQLRERDALLARAMRFAIAGELASALAHELNQPITALVSYLRASEILASQSSTDERLQTTLGKAAQEGIRASEVLRRLRDFYQGGVLKREAVHIPSVCSAVANAFQDRLRHADASLEIALDPGIPTLQGDGMQLEIVLHNLLANALDAVAQVKHSQRRIRLSGSCSHGTVTICVEDSGPGIPADMSGRLFEPFVTSKPDGMGLGLAIGNSLIRARGGELSFTRSEELGGAAFVIRLPVEMPRDTLTV